MSRLDFYTVHELSVQLLPYELRTRSLFRDVTWEALKYWSRL